MTTNGRLRLLVLESDAVQIELVSRAASVADWEIRTAIDSVHFFEQLDTWQPHCVLLDLVMPAGDGVHIMQDLSRRLFDMPLILTSASGKHMLEAAGRSAREQGLAVVGLLPKPFMPNLLLGLLGRVAAGGVRRRPRAAVCSPERSDLEKAIRNGELYAVYQPKISARTGALTGFEALARWRHPERGEIGPDVFIPAAEAYGLIDALTEYIFDEALTWFGGLCSSLPGAGLLLGGLQPATLTLSINLSAISLTPEGALHGLEPRCRAAGVSPSQVALEITESSATSRPLESLELLARLRAQGFRLSIDDFGIGYSSMSQLVRLPFSEIKIDKSFVMNAADSETSRSVCHALVMLGHSLGMRVTAEGVEDAETQEYLVDLGCDFLQGYFISRPLQAAMVMDWIRALAVSNEQRRVASLRRLVFLESDTSDQRFVRIVSLARSLLGVKVAAIQIVDHNTVWPRVAEGAELLPQSRAKALCARCVADGVPVIVGDLRRHPGDAGQPPSMASRGMRFYAAVPLHAPDGEVVATLCVLDDRPRVLGEEAHFMLNELGLMAELELAGSADAAPTPAVPMDERAFWVRARALLSLAERAGRCATLLMLGGVRETELDPLYRMQAERLAAAFSPADLIGALSDGRFCVLTIDADEDIEARLATLSDMLSDDGDVAAPRLRLGRVCSRDLDDGDVDRLHRMRMAAELDLLRAGGAANARRLGMRSA